MNQQVYVVVTTDEYELPIFVCDTLDELSDVMKIKKETLSCYICRGKGVKKHYKILRVMLDGAV